MSQVGSSSDQENPGAKPFSCKRQVFKRKFTKFYKRVEKEDFSLLLPGRTKASLPNWAIRVK